MLVCVSCKVLRLQFNTLDGYEIFEPASFDRISPSNLVESSTTNSFLLRRVTGGLPACVLSADDFRGNARYLFSREILEKK